MNQKKYLFETVSSTTAFRRKLYDHCLIYISIAFAGDEGVGKTSLIHRFTTGKWLIEPIRSLDLQVAILNINNWPMKDHSSEDGHIFWHINTAKIVTYIYYNGMRKNHSVKSSCSTGNFWHLLFRMTLHSSFSRYAFLSDLTDLTYLKVDFYSLLLYVLI